MTLDLQTCKLSDIANNDVLRSQVMKKLISSNISVSGIPNSTPKTLIQFWDNISSIPPDVQKCLDTWRPLEAKGFNRLMFDDSSANEFIQHTYSLRHVEAFNKCKHPAMRSDYFRLCYIAARGGIYIDADDVYSGVPMESLIDAGHLILQPLCYDLTTDSMLDPVELSQCDDDPNLQRIFYVNNNPIISPPGHPVIEAALERSTRQLINTRHIRDVQSLTGPGNLTMVLADHAVRLIKSGHSSDYILHQSWEEIASSKWPLEYRTDARNWRIWKDLPSEDYTTSCNEMQS